MRLSPRRPRPAFTLLEVLLASLIAVLLLGALYFTMDLTLRRTQDSRDMVEVDNLARGVFNRLTIDASCALGPLPPKSGGNSNSAAATQTTESAAAPTTTDPATTGTTTTDPAAADPAATETTDPAATTAAADVPFQAGVIGTENQLTMFVARVADVGGFDPNVQGRADLRRITYWLGSNGGLCRQERPWVTADGIRNSVDPDQSFGEEADTIAAEVTELLFEYFDGSGWAGTWDGQILGPDGVTPQGPPRAIRVTLTMKFPPARGGEPVTKTAVQVIPIRAAPGTYTPPLLDPYTEGTTTTEATTTDTGTGTSTGTGGTGGTGGTTTTGGGP